MSSKKQASSRKQTPAPEHPLFAEFWSAYPRREGKGKAREAFSKAVANGATPEVLVGAAGRFARHHARIQTEAKYIAMPTTWLNQERWEDEIELEKITDSPLILPPHCGSCDPANRWIELPDGSYDRCPDCNPDAIRSRT